MPNSFKVSPMITKKQVFTAVLFSGLAFSFMVACHAPKKSVNNTPVHTLVSLFADLPALPDTVHFFLPENPAGKLVSGTQLKSCLDSTAFDNLQFGTGDVHFWAVGKFPFTHEVDACLLLTEESWFGKQTLLFYQKKQDRILSTLEVANFYGGDGGQTATESWWFRKSAPSKIFIQSAEHGIRMHEETEPTEYLSESGALLQWEQRTFKTMPNPDSSLFLQKLKMHREW